MKFIICLIFCVISSKSIAQTYSIFGHIVDQQGMVTSNFSFSRSFFGDALNVQIGVNDIFDKNKNRAKIIV
ncbi:MAG: hypothetical protein LBP63_07650, partial [Prevotellaceae bacterium]|nr:hypothetical protein [Prevotellaceae bacterium]